MESKDIAKIAVELAMSNRRSEQELKNKYLKMGIKTAGVDIGGNVINSIPTILERTLVAIKKNDITPDTHAYVGAITGATREAIDQILGKSIGFSFGGKIGIARYKGHLSVCIFGTIGMFKLDEVVIGLGHRALPQD